MDSNDALNRAKIKRIDETIPFNVKQTLKCLMCGDSFVTSPKGILQKFKHENLFGCKKCKQLQRYARERTKEIEKLSPQFEFLKINLQDSQKQTVTVKNKECGHIFETKLWYLIQFNVRCNICCNKNAHENFKGYKKQPYSKQKILEMIEKRNNRFQDKWVICLNIEEYQEDIFSKLWFTCKRGHKWQSIVNNIVNNDSGCPECNKNNLSERYRRPVKEILEKFKKVHGELYEYPFINEEYKSINDNISIKCNKHGIFKQKGGAHYHQKQGCPACAIEKSKTTREEFVEKAISVHANRYDYSKTEFFGYGSDKPYITVICKSHGEFQTKASWHVFNKSGCPVCSLNGYSHKCIAWLKYLEKTLNLSIQHAENGGELTIPNTRFKADGYCKDTNTIYEFHGSVFHGDPHIFAKNNCCHPFDKKITAGELLEKTEQREQAILALGYNLVTIWESEWDTLSEDFALLFGDSK